MKRLLILSILILLPVFAGAQSLPLLYCPTDARSAAMGGAGVALSDADAFALDNNFAAADLSNDVFAIGATYNRWAPQPSPDTRFAAGGWFRSNRFAIGLSAKGSFSQPYDIVSPYGETKGSFQPNDYSFALGAAWRPVPGFALSATGRMVSSALSEEATGVAFCADLGLMYYYQGLSFGLTACNIGGKIRYGDNAYALPTLIRGGFAYSFTTVDISAELDYLAGAGVMGGAGVEYWPFSVCCLRAGYHFGAEDKGLPSFGSAGLGIFVNGFGLDVTALFASPALGGSILAGVSYRF